MPAACHPSNPSHYPTLAFCLFPLPCLPSRSLTCLSPTIPSPFLSHPGENSLGSGVPSFSASLLPTTSLFIQLFLLSSSSLPRQEQGTRTGQKPASPSRLTLSHSSHQPPLPSPYHLPTTITCSRDDRMMMLPHIYTHSHLPLPCPLHHTTTPFCRLLPVHMHLTLTWFGRFGLGQFE